MKSNLQKSRMVLNSASVLTFAVLVLTTVLGTEIANAQQAPTITVQQPTFSFFTANSTLNVPDRGQALIGSIKRSSMGSVSRGVPILGNVPYLGRMFGNRAIGSENSASTLSARVQIYDLREMDRALLAEARRDRVLKLGGEEVAKQQVRRQAIKKKADFISRNLGRSQSRR